MVKRDKKQPTIHHTLQNAVVTAINDPNYSFSLPQLADWESIVSSSVDEKQRLEFVGDAIMHLSVALYLYRLFPNATPGFYTNIRSVVNTNATFTHLMAKAGAYELPSQPHSTKAVADSFEVIVAALYMERGFSDVYAWVQEQYAPLVAAARESYDKSPTALDNSVPSSSTKRRAGSLDPVNAPLLKKIKLSNARSMISRNTLMAQRIIKRMRSKGKVKLYFPTKKPNLPLEMRLRSRELRTPRTPSIVIDLTADNDAESEEPTPSKATQASQPNLKSPAPSQSLSPSRPTSEPSRRFESVDSLWRGSSLSLDLPHEPSRSPSWSSSCTAATTPGGAVSTFSQANLRSRTDLSLPPQLDRTHLLSGTYGNPIVIEDSDSEG